jgi:hypothetical protein
MDVSFLLLVLAAAVVLIVPWSRLTGLTVGAVGLTLDRAVVNAALSSRLDRVDDERLRSRLAELESEIDAAKGGRVLWVDDHPELTIGERRILRALGLLVVPASSSADVERELLRDGDFDLLITDVQRAGSSYEQVSEGVPIHEGANFVLRLRRGHVPSLAGNQLVQNIHVVFYAAYELPRLKKYTEQVRTTRPEPDVTNNVGDLVVAVVKGVARARTQPIQCPTKKVPSAPPYGDNDATPRVGDG